ncbi:PAS domain S-box-containing protein/diguanylate cyclase (GGDEF) domain-containing protein [Marinobacter antarcticus]|uniref:PAS domain S-box-containing protein/diguanylate cyclase (GGDEF) domain-containing protein n=1 Tax=Marinobacter antarcticus TaxID=564117 RepID=A0A1M6R951_9GAMM|nr:EAL domain-containing protein [Marinobacter antarcticus]SHK29003.1 PAS domain S-box-containing protein/diguanylate cyclase (GGDEF) domain-containing protein [Marinobacter antarcticus]
MTQGAPENARIQRLTQLYRALSEINQAIVRISDEEELFPLVCKIAVDFGGVSMAWIGVADLKSEQIAPVESYGTGTDYLKNIQISTQKNTPEGRGPTATAYHNNHSVITCDWATNPMTEPWHEQAKRFGWASGGSFPIQRNGEPFAVLSVYHEAADFFDGETIGLLDEAARDLEFALDNFDRERARHNAVEALRANEQHFRAYFERSMFGMAATRPDRSWMEVNQALCDMLGYTAEELTTTTWEDLTHPDDREANNTLFQQLLDGSIDEFVIEKRFVRKTHDLIDVHLAVRAVRNADGALAYAVSLIEDISIRKLVERREQMRELTLEKVARGASLNEILLQVIQSSESIYPGSMCSILLMDDEGKHLLKGAAPSLPDFFNEAINGVEIGIGVGSCGTAAFLGKRVFVEEIATHPYWENYKELAADAGLASCWSEPIHSVPGKILGTFAIYRQEPGAPDKHEIALIESAANLVGIAIERTYAEAELHLASSIYSNSSEAVLVTDANNRIVALNPAFTRITGYTLEDIRGQSPSVLRSTRHDADFYQSMWKEITRRGFWQGEIWNRRKDGETFPEWLTINAIYNDEGDIQRYVAMGSDITSKVRSDELIWRQANYDFLTDLPNRYMFQDRLEQEIRKSRRQDSLLALLFIDLDHFKDVNDTLGHPVGDQLLIKAAKRINDCVRGSDTVARMGGDEFTIILPELAKTIDAEKVAEQVINVLAEPYFIDNETIYAQASIGITFCPDDASEVDQLISNADQAMYASKMTGRNRLSYFTRSLHDEAQNRLKLLNDMRSAVENRQFELHFQPIINLATGHICKAEALIRWNHPERGMISPAEFIPLAEESGLIVGIGDWVFRESAAQAKRWCDLFNKGLQISVNMSPVQFQSDALNITDWLTYLQTLGLDEKYLSIEITEGLLLNASDDVKDKLLLFKDAGIEVAIDDFGVGYSALSYLKRFDIDYLKIDQSFIQNLETEQNDLVLSEAIVVMAHKLGLKVIAEGVETEAQRRLLLEIGCDNGQGYFFSRPLPAAEFEDFLKKARGLSA